VGNRRHKDAKFERDRRIVDGLVEYAERRTNNQGGKVGREKRKNEVY